jgi:hypothetical protein
MFHYGLSEFLPKSFVQIGLLGKILAGAQGNPLRSTRRSWQPIYSAPLAPQGIASQNRIPPSSFSSELPQTGKMNFDILYAFGLLAAAGNRLTSTFPKAFRRQRLEQLQPNVFAQRIRALCLK